MNNQMFNEIQERQQNNSGQPFWGEFAKKYGYENPEKLRAEYRREKAKKNSYTITSEEVPSNQPKILIFDLETSPLISYHWGLWNQNIQPDRIIQDWHLICWGAKWLYSDTVLSDVLTPEEAVKHDDYRIVKSLWELMNQADILVAHSGRGFDLPRSNSRFLFYGLQPPHFSRLIDTLDVAKKSFGFTSNSLNYICGFLKLEGKKETQFSLWRDCMNGDKKALEEMRLYCCQDIHCLEDVLVAVKSWIKPGIGYGLWNDSDDYVCPNCGGDSLVEYGEYHTQVNTYQSYRCSDCGALSRGRKSTLSKEKKKSLLM